MNFEQNRLETFATWPSDAPVPSTKIARAGFYYTGNDLQVQCYFCDKKISTWSYADQVMLRHRLLNPSCPFVLNPLSSNNVIIQNVCNISNHSNEKLHKQIDLSKSMGNGLNRLRTFCNDRIFIQVQMYTLAANGFYAVNSKDCIKCIECGLIIHDWIGTIDPISYHKEQKPTCTKTNAIYLDSIDESNVPKCIAEAFSEHLNEFSKRLETYVAWPHKYPDPRSLSFAGLYFTNEQDFVRCYYCDIGLRKWLSTDNPLLEHARSSPTCKYLESLLSKSFIQMCVNFVENQDLEKTPPNKNISKLEAEIRNLKESRMCKICLDREIAIVFMPCGHLLTCEQCAITLSLCPLCRGHIFETVRTYIS